MVVFAQITFCELPRTKNARVLLSITNDHRGAAGAL